MLGRQSAKFAARPLWLDAVGGGLRDSQDHMLQALTEAETGGIIAAPTAALSEVPGAYD